MRDNTEKHLEQRLHCCTRVTFLLWRLLFCFQVERRIAVPLTTFWAWGCWISTVFFSVCCFTQSLFQPSWKVTKRWKVARKPRTFVFFPSKNTERNRNYHLFLLFENCGNFCTSNDLNFLHFAYVWVQAQEAKCQVGLQNSVTFLALGQYKTCTNCWNTNKACTFSEYGDATQLYHLSSKLFLLCSQLENRAIMFSSDEVEKLSKHAFTTLLSLRNKFLQLFEWLKDDDDHKFEHPKEKPQETNFWENVYHGEVFSSVFHDIWMIPYRTCVFILPPSVKNQGTLYEKKFFTDFSGRKGSRKRGTLSEKVKIWPRG